MTQLFECVPDYSEGRDRAKVDAIVNEITSVKHIHLLDVQLDANHNRSVVTFVGPADAVAEAAFRSTKKAATLIDLNHHRGEHPRMGATDVCPFIPLYNASLPEAIAIANRVGERIGRELGIPVYLYSSAAKKEDRRDLPKVRAGEFEGLREEIGVNPEKVPDFGPNRIHSTAGATAVGAREFLIAFNINLESNNLAVADRIARNVRQKSGGFKEVRALGFELADRGIVQVSMNLVNYKVTGLLPVFEAVSRQAKAKGINVLESELVGLLPMQALLDAGAALLGFKETAEADSLEAIQKRVAQKGLHIKPLAPQTTPLDALVQIAADYLKVRDFSPSQIIENRLIEMGLMKSYTPQPSIYSCYTPFIDMLSSSAPAPGGGTAAALVGALAGALGVMVCNLTAGKKKFKEVEPHIVALREKTTTLRDELSDLARKDAEAFNEVANCMAMPRETDAEKQARAQAMEQATYGAIQVPLTVMQRCLDTLEAVQEIAKHGNPNAASDAGVAALLALAALRGARLNVEINLLGIRGEQFKEKCRNQCNDIEIRARKLESSSLDIVGDKIK